MPSAYRRSAVAECLFLNEQPPPFYKAGAESFPVDPQIDGKEQLGLPTLHIAMQFSRLLGTRLC